MTRICPKRDAICPHGMECPYVIDRYSCKPDTEYSITFTEIEAFQKYYSGPLSSKGPDIRGFADEILEVADRIREQRKELKNE